MTLDLFNTETHEQMRCGFLHRDDKRMGFIGVESTMNPRLRGFYTFSNLEQVKELRLFLEEFEKRWEENSIPSEERARIEFDRETNSGTNEALAEFDNLEQLCDTSK